MDNLTHSLTGLAVGELIHRSLPAEPQAENQGLRRYLMLLTCWLASNFPDLDLLLTPLLPRPLGYLLHHRGHTHTLLVAIPEGLLLCALIWAIWPAARRLLRESGSARRGFALAAALGLVLHIAMDGLNVYGVHPFHPFDSRWMFGDMVFIVEPLFWMAFGIPVAMAARRTWTAYLLALPLLAAPLFFASQAYLTWLSAVVLLVLGGVLGALQIRAGERGKAALVAGGLAAIGFVVIQGAAGAQARRMVTQDLQAKDPSTRVLDVALNAFPANPLCWQFVSIEDNEASATYRLRRGQLTLASEWLSLTGCPAKLREPRAAPTNAASASNANPAKDGAQNASMDAAVDATINRSAYPAIDFLAETTGSLQQFRALQRENCHFDAWLRFARVPLLSGPRATDIRFSPAMTANFTTIDLQDMDAAACPSAVPAWGQPRADLLGAPNAAGRK
ncbi:hypothetical protein BH11PSE11_BH11PSE11_07370 [soil metagenome]